MAFLYCRFFTPLCTTVMYLFIIKTHKKGRGSSTTWALLGTCLLWGHWKFQEAGLRHNLWHNLKAYPGPVDSFKNVMQEHSHVTSLTDPCISDRSRKLHCAELQRCLEKCSLCGCYRSTWSIKELSYWKAICSRKQRRYHHTTEKCS